MWNTLGQILFSVVAIVGVVKRDTAMIYGGLACALGYQILGELEDKCEDCGV